MVSTKKKAFTLLELVMVIVVLAILSTLAMRNSDRDIRQEAADNILSAIRYTQHLALIDNVILPTQANWQRSFWRFGIQKCNDDGIFYTVSSDKSMEGNIDDDEEAYDPANKRRLNGLNSADCEGSISGQGEASPNIFLTHKYGISWTSGVAFNNCGTSAGNYIGFDYLGRPHRGFAGSSGSTSPDFSTLLHTDCEIEFSFDDSSIDPIVIIIAQETGYAYIEDQNAS